MSMNPKAPNDVNDLAFGIRLDCLDDSTCILSRETQNGCIKTVTLHAIHAQYWGQKTENTMLNPQVP